MTREEALSHYRKHFDMDNEIERSLCLDTIGRLERATRASDIAAVVGRLYGQDGIDSSVVKSGPFIESVIAIAVNVKYGRSVNNVRDHIKNMMFRDEWEKRERQDRERREQTGRRFRINGNTVTINFAINMDIDKLAIFKEIVGRLNATLSEVDISRFDGAPKIMRRCFQTSGSAAAVAELLHRVHDDIGPSALLDIRYTSHATGLERSCLSLAQTILLADNEKEL